MKLVVKHEFAAYKVGDQITDPTTVADILASEQQHNVIKVALSDADIATAAKTAKTK